MNMKTLQRGKLISPLKACSLIVGIVLCVCSCSGGSNTNAVSSTVASQGGNPENQGPVTSNIVVLPRIAEQPNTVSPDIAQDSRGDFHAVYGDIDGRAYYAFCTSPCQSGSDWSGIELLQESVQGSSGALTPKLIVDDAGVLHVAIAVNEGNFGILSNQTVHYARCDSDCLNVLNWTSGLALTLNRAQLESNLQQARWFAVTASGQPRIAIVEPSDPSRGDEFFYYFSCLVECHMTENWSREIAAELTLASTKPVNLMFDNTGAAHVVLEYRTIGASSSKLLYLRCEADCASTTPVWGDPVELLTMPERSLSSNVVSFTLLNETTPVIVVYEDGDETGISLLSCQTDCSGARNWSQRDLLSEIQFSQNLQSLAPVIEVESIMGDLTIAMVAEEPESSYPNRLFTVSCGGLCANASWIIDNLADASAFEFNNEGCLPLGTGVNGPVSLMRDGVGFGITPYWGCSLATGDIRFLEIAAFRRR